MPRNRKNKAKPQHPATPPLPTLPKEKRPTERGWRTDDYIVLLAQEVKASAGFAFVPFRSTAFLADAIDMVVDESEEKEEASEGATHRYLLYCFGGRHQFHVRTERPFREFLDFIAPAEDDDEDDEEGCKW